MKYKQYIFGDTAAVDTVSLLLEGSIHAWFVGWFGEEK